MLFHDAMRMAQNRQCSVPRYAEVFIMNQVSTSLLVEKIFEIFRASGHHGYGENVTQQEHALQCAYFAEQSGEPEEIVLSCLLHDLGHMIYDSEQHDPQPAVDVKHEEIAASFLEGRFHDAILEPIRQHVAAKRYLCWKSPEYMQGLSDASRYSLRLQGGPMTELEAREFEANPFFEACVKVRRYDDMGKVPGMQTATLESYHDLIARHLLRATSDL
jgi:[1-hydroxy-2-(trimethylamino)ethyl]phosphonate dioxygenase